MKVLLMVCIAILILEVSENVLIILCYRANNRILYSILKIIPILILDQCQDISSRN